MTHALAVVVLVVVAQGVAAQSIDELQRQIKERDARIRELTERVEALERNVEPDLELNRALERTLVQQGALLLAPGVYELQPQFAYSRWDPERSTLRHQYELALGARAGLPWDSQLQLRAPYVYVSSAAGSGNAMGDADFVVSKQVARESGVRPGTFLSLGWTSRTGRDGLDGRAPTGNGFNILQVGLTVAKRQDPLVYTGTISYADARARTIEGVRLDPGSTFGLRFGGLLAIAPDVSLSLGASVAFVGASHVDGRSVPGTDTVVSTLQLGFGAVLTRSTMLLLGGEYRFSGNVALTESAPNFRLSAALPIRF